MSLLHELLRKAPSDPIITDGSIGTLSAAVMSPGMKHADELVSTNPEWVHEAHNKFADAGADISHAFTYTLNRQVRPDLTEDQIFDQNRLAVQIAVRALEGKPVLVAGRIGPLQNEMISDPGSPDLPSHIPFQQAVSMYRTQMEGCIAGGADLLSVEKIRSKNSVLAALEGAHQANSIRNSKTPLILTMNFGVRQPVDGWATTHGMRPQDLVSLTNDQKDVVAIGSSCGLGFRNAGSLAAEFFGLNPNRTIVWMRQNAGLLVDDAVVPPYFDMASGDFARGYARDVYNAGARVIGGCCGTTPRLITEMKAELS